MNIHEHQAKEILNEFGAPVSKGVVILSPDEIEQKKCPTIEIYKNFRCTKKSC